MFSTEKMWRAFYSPKMFVAPSIFALVVIVIYMGRENEMLRLIAPQTEARIELVIPTSAVKINRTKARLNVIILTHMSSGSTLVGNIFNLHPDVFYIYEPLNTLRRKNNTNEWRALEKPSNDAYRQDFSTLLRDLFTCGFDEERTIELAFPKWARPFNAWDNRSIPLTKEWLRKACKARKVTVTKIMQTRLPREGGILELEQVCRSDPSKFDCFIVHQVRDPRAVLSSLISKSFYSLEPAADLFKMEPMSPEGKKLLMENAQMLCTLVSENLHYVNVEWFNWFKSRYILVRYEDIMSNIAKEASDIYKYFGLAMVDIITNWIKGIPPPGMKEQRFYAMVISINDTSTVNKWRFHEEPSRISLFEEACGSLMEITGYILVNGSKHLQYDESKPLQTPNIPFLRNPGGQ